jgi:hypothetical protein
MSAPITFKQYDPSQVKVAFKGTRIVGFQDGTFLDAEREEQGFTKHTGSFGDVTRTRNLNRTGKVTLTLMAQSPVNDLLQAIATSDEQFGDGVGTLHIRDLNGNMLCHASLAWIQKMPKVERGKEAGATVWVLECADLEINAGGNVV